MLGGHLVGVRALGLELDHLGLERRHLLVHRPQVLVLLLGGAPHRRHRPGLEVGQRVVLVGRGELLEQVRAHVRRGLGHDRAQLVLDGDARLRPEQPLELLGQVAVLRPEHVVDALAQELGDDARLVRERLLDLARDLLELRPHELGVDLGLLAGEDPGADLDRVDQHAGGVGPGLLAVADEVHGDAVAHGEAVGDDDVAEERDPGWAQGRGSFHDGRVAR